MVQVVSTPAPGIASLNDVRGNGLNVDITSNDGSVVITSNQVNRTVDLSQILVLY
jgi:hypothetical protein